MASEITYKIPSSPHIPVLIQKNGGFNREITLLVMSYLSPNLNLILTKDKYGKFLFIVTDDKLRLGTLTFYWYRPLPSGKFGYETGEVASFHYGGSYGQQTQISNIFIETVFTQKNQGVGTLLLQAAIEWGLQHQCEGRTTLQAVGNSHWFWFLKGFRARGKWKNVTNQEIEEELTSAKTAKREPDTRDHHSVEMQLPEIGIQAWREKINAFPLLLQ